jgi:hypothetical protein
MHMDFNSVSIDVDWFEYTNTHIDWLIHDLLGRVKLNIFTKIKK